MSTRDSIAHYSQTSSMAVHEVPVTLQLRAGAVVECLQGGSWLTIQSRMDEPLAEDHILFAGERMSIERGGRVYVSSLRKASARIRIIESDASPGSGTGVTTWTDRLLMVLNGPLARLRPVARIAV